MEIRPISTRFLNPKPLLCPSVFISNCLLLRSYENIAVWNQFTISFFIFSWPECSSLFPRTWNSFRKKRFTSASVSRRHFNRVSPRKSIGHELIMRFYSISDTVGHLLRSRAALAGTVADKASASRTNENGKNKSRPAEKFSILLGERENHAKVHPDSQVAVRSGPRLRTRADHHYYRLVWSDSEFFSSPALVCRPMTDLPLEVIDSRHSSQSRSDSPKRTHPENGPDSRKGPRTPGRIRRPGRPQRPAPRVKFVIIGTRAASDSGLGCCRCHALERQCGLIRGRLPRGHPSACRPVA